MVLVSKKWPFKQLLSHALLPSSGIITETDAQKFDGLQVKLRLILFLI